MSGLLLDRVADISALISDIGGPCWATGLTAAGLCQFDQIRLRRPYHIVVMRDRNVRRIGHVVHTTIELDPIDREVVLGVPSVSPTRALIEISGRVERDVLTAALDGALRDGLTSEDFLHRRIGALRSKGRHGIPTLLEVLEGHEITRGGQSWLEREMLRLIDAAGLPRPATQQVLGRRGTRLIRVDFWWEGTPVIVETLGYRWHRTGAQMTIDAARMNRLVLDGKVPLQFTYSQVVDHPDDVIATLATGLQPFFGPQPLRRSA